MDGTWKRHRKTKKRPLWGRYNQKMPAAPSSRQTIPKSAAGAAATSCSDSGCLNTHVLLSAMPMNTGGFLFRLLRLGTVGISPFQLSNDDMFFVSIPRILIFRNGLVLFFSVEYAIIFVLFGESGEKPGRARRREVFFVSA